MKKAMTFSFFMLSAATACLATDIIENAGIKYRGHDLSIKERLLRQEEKQFATGQRESKENISIDGKDMENDPEILDAVFSHLGEVWEAFKRDDYKTYIVPLTKLKCEEPPAAFYLLGKAHEKGAGKIQKHLGQAFEFYSFALAACDEKANPLLYHLLLATFNRVRDRITADKMSR